jgi:FKBP-type peptidyl-prolyl cis-trans isomerase FkpA/FKBP-type peptidyl-prolyl cis-trans isomerase FklB
MKLNNLSLAVILSAVLLVSACEQKMNSNYEADLSSQIDSVSYAIGYQNGMLLDNEGLTDIDMENYLAGFNKALNSEEGVMEREELFAVINSYVQELSQRRGSENVEKGEAFLEENKDKEGVMVTESGLQYKVIEQGDGESPTAENVVRVHYEGTLINGEVFDSSYDRGQPAEFPLNRVIPGWTEGVQLMREGATYEFYIPSDLAYGAQAPQGSPIGPNETLIFKVELLEVKPAE